MTNKDKIIQNAKNALNNKVSAIYFNERNNMAFYDWFRNHEATSVHNLIFLFCLGPKFCPQKDKITFWDSEDKIERLRRDIGTRLFVLNNTHADETKEILRLHRKNMNRKPEKASRPIE